MLGTFRGIADQSLLSVREAAGEVYRPFPDRADSGAVSEERDQRAGKGAKFLSPGRVIQKQS